MKLFEVQTDLTSYSYPVVKILICVSVIILSIVRDHIFRFSSSWADILVSILCFALSIISILCLYISIGELFHTASNRRNTHYRPSDVKQLTIEAVTKIVSENGIVEIEVCTDDETVMIGESSECKYSSSVFENKLFYISSSEYDTIELFAKALTELFPNGIIPVSKIDGLPVE
ncbi:MAG: hypothetical protein ACI4VI_10490 [Acutalibacteraceae bacterium]